MNEQEVMQYAGNIIEELEEFDKRSDESENIVVYATQTKACQQFLTIYCC